MKITNTIFIASSIFISLLLLSCSQKPKDNLPPFVKSKMNLVWSDEFDYSSTSPNPENWGYNTGGGGWGNGELQTYTDSAENSFITKDGTLKIVAKKNDKGRWTSARILSRYKKTFDSGYIEFRAKLPTEKGCWPALWMLPQQSAYGTWPRSGEIDVMEFSPNVWGSTAYGTLHCLNGSGGKPISSTGHKIKSAQKWHTYAINWTESSISWYYDGECFAEYQNPQAEKDNWKAWPYDIPYFIIMNVAMGGTLGGNIPTDLTTCEMEVDYVRVYQ